MLLRSQARLNKVIGLEPLCEEVKELWRERGVVFEEDHLVDLHIIFPHSSIAASQDPTPPFYPTSPCYQTESASSASDSTVPAPDIAPDFAPDFPISFVPDPHPIPGFVYLPPARAYTQLDFIQPAVESPWGNLLVEENFNQLKERIQSWENHGSGLNYQVYQHLRLEDRDPHWDRSFCLALWRKLNTNTLDI